MKMSGIDATLTQQEERGCQCRHAHQKRIKCEETRKQEAALCQNESDSSSNNHENDDDEDDY